jgi:cellulose 1,4-beta-cellobiosidase
MFRSFGRTTARRTAPWLLAATLAALGSGSNAIAQSCNITYNWPTWTGGNGFGASIDIRNTGPAITNGWSLVFSFPNGQQLQNGWPVAFAQSGSQLTISSNAAWNQAIATNGVFNVGFNGTFSGANNPPTAFTLNGTACTIGNNPGNTPPTVSLTSPTANQSFASGAAVPLAATASDPGGAVTSVVFRVDGNVVNTDTTAPYSFSVTGLANGTHTATATANDNGNPSLSATSSTVTFTVGNGNTPPTVSVTSPTAGQNFAANTAIPLAATAADPRSRSRWAPRTRRRRSPPRVRRPARTFRPVPP